MLCTAALPRASQTGHENPPTTDVAVSQTKRLGRTWQTFERFCSWLSAVAHAPRQGRYLKLLGPFSGYLHHSFPLPSRLGGIDKIRWAGLTYIRLDKEYSVILPKWSFRTVA
jgi:hypothetical protein